MTEITVTGFSTHEDREAYKNGEVLGIGALAAVAAYAIGAIVKQLINVGL